MNALWDLLEADIAEITSEELTEAVKLVQSVTEKRGGDFKVAFVAPDEVSYGITRMFEAYGYNLGFQMLSFRSTSEASSWLET